MKTFITDVAAAAALVTLAVAPAVAKAQPVTVEFADLDIHSAQGKQALAKRIDAAVRTACEKPEIRDPRAMQSWEECKQDARAEAARQLPRTNTAA